jgi:hypothetical protein
MTSVTDLDLAEDKLANARVALAKIEALRDSYEAKIEPLEARQAELTRLIGDATIASALGEVPADHGDALRAELDALTIELAECTSARDAADRRIGPARQAVNHAGGELRAAIAALAKPLAAAIEEETRDAFRKAYALQRLFCVVSETSSPGSWDGHSMLMHGQPDSPGSLPVIARSEGIIEANLRPTVPLQALSLDELRTLIRDRAS